MLTARSVHLGNGTILVIAMDMCRVIRKGGGRYPRPVRSSCIIRGEASLANVQEGPASSGNQPVHVSVQWRVGRPAGRTRADRKAALAAEFRALLGTAEHIHVDWDSLSLAAQTVEALLDADYASSVTARLEALGLRVDPVIDRQIIT